MWSTSLYIIVCTAKNRLRVRLARMREPRYLLGAVAAIVYLYFSIFARRFGSRRSSSSGPGRSGSSLQLLAAARGAAPAAAGVGLLILTAASWAMPVNSGLLDFSEAETAILFPAPVSRRALLVHRLLRSQLGLLFGALIMGIATPSVSGFARVRISVAMWLILLTGKLYFTGITLARARVAEASGRARRAAWLPVGLTCAAVAVVGTSLVREFASGPLKSLQDVIVRLNRATATPLAHVVLWPFAAIARPLFAEWPGPYVWSLVWALVVCAAVMAWVLKSDEAFQEAAAETAAKRAAAKSQPARRLRARGASVPLALSGRAETAFAWKALMQTVRVVDRRSLLRIAAIIAVLSVIAVSGSAARGLAVTLGLFATVGAGFAVVMGPQALRIDLRQDLQHLDVLKTWPVRASALVRGEMLWPGAFVTLITWALLGLALFLSAGVFARTSVQLRIAAAVSAALLAPAIVFAQFAIQNGVALMFPAWVPLGDQRVRGLDAMGQRLILLGGTLLVLVVMLLPGALAGGIVWFAFRRFVDVWSIVPAAAVCAAIVGVEVLLITEALGPVYERLDLSSIERGE
jgi:ABC-2 type transport system permease protein